MINSNCFDFQSLSMTIIFSSKIKILSKMDETLFLQIELSKSNYVIPWFIQWIDTNLPDEWIL